MRYAMAVAGAIAAVLGATPYAHAAWNIAGGSNGSPAVGVNGATTRVQTPAFATGSRKPSCDRRHTVKVEWVLSSTGQAPTAYRLSVTLGASTTHEHFTAPASSYVSRGAYPGDVTVTLSSRLGGRWLQTTAPVVINNC